MDMSGFMPHGHCILWIPSLLSLHVVTDLIIALSYFSIPAGIIVFVRHKHLQDKLIPFLFVSFIITCGITHLFTVWNWWNTNYWLSGVFKVLCAVASATTAGTIWYIMPRALKLPTPEDLRKLNYKLETLNIELEEKVKERTFSLEHAMSKIEKLSEEKTRFFASIAHELKNHVQVIKMGAEVLQNEDASKEEVSTIANKIDSNSNALLVIVGDLLELGKLESGKVKIVKSEINLKKLLYELESEYTDKASKCNLGFQLKIMDGIPEKIVTDEVRLRQILVNLLNNSVKYTEKGHIELKCCQRKKRLAFTVRDTGSGIPKEDAERIFKLFTRSDKHSQIEGAGLGLALSQEYAKLLNGEITLDDTSKEGSSFTLKIPLGSA